MNYKSISYLHCSETRASRTQRRSHGSFQGARANSRCESPCTDSQLRSSWLSVEQHHARFSPLWSTLFDACHDPNETHTNANRRRTRNNQRFVLCSPSPHTTPILKKPRSHPALPERSKAYLIVNNEVKLTTRNKIEANSSNKKSFTTLYSKDRTIIFAYYSAFKQAKKTTKHWQ
jgi:hypothetical protein